MLRVPIRRLNIWACYRCPVITDHMGSNPTGIGYFCARSVCIHYPRYTCEADHSNPVELPEICGRYPPYLREIIRLSRLQDPEARPSARKLAKMIEGTEDPDTRTIDIEKLLRTYATGNKPCIETNAVL